LTAEAITDMPRTSTDSSSDTAPAQRAPTRPAPTNVTVLGSTGTIGVNTLDVIRRHPQRYRVAALTAHRDVDRLYEQCVACKPRFAAIDDARKATELRQRLLGAGIGVEVLAGPQGLERVAGMPDTHCLMAAIVGAAGLLPTLAAARAGKRILLANKEALVMAGTLFMRYVRESQAQLLPIDSEHNAVFQCLPQNLQSGGPQSLGAEDALAAAGVESIVLTASGGPFRNMPLAQLRNVTPAQACAHPNWKMGRKISVDSATMMNKGLEVIEACWLFDCSPEQVQVVLHPQSVVHSMVSYADGSVLAQLGNPDMRTPIAHALAWPERISSGARPLNLIEVGRLEFFAVEQERFPCLRLAYEALRAGGTSTAILNAANEVAVQSFLDNRIGFTDIPRVIEHTLAQLASADADSLEAILAADRAARVEATRYIASVLTTV
jgi:1-deoxy-D-xylulose-5-phosphate reductoisomerase